MLKSLLEKAKARATRPVSIRLSVADIELAKNIADKRGTGYQTVIKEALHYGLKRAGQFLFCVLLRDRMLPLIAILAGAECSHTARRSAETLYRGMNAGREERTGT